MELAASTALVTGGASGIGAGVARMLAESGARVVILDLSTSAGRDLAEELGPSVHFAPADVTNTDQVQAAVDAAVDRFGHLDILVGGAGVTASARVVSRDLAPFPLSLFRRGIEVNLIGAFDVIRLSAAAMARNPPNGEGERGVIVTISSIAAFEGQVGQASYSASKAGIVGMTLPIARDLAVHGIRVMTIAPGTIDTPILHNVPEHLRSTLVANNVFPPRAGRADDIATAVRFCIENTYLNAEVIRVDAGARLPPR